MTQEEIPESAQPLPDGGSKTKLGVSVYAEDASASSATEGGTESGLEYAKKKLDAGTIAAKETRTLFISRIVVGFVLVLAGAGAGLLTYFVSSNEQQESFENQVRMTKRRRVCSFGILGENTDLSSPFFQFMRMADELFSASDSIFSGAAGAFLTMSSTMTTFSQSQATEWPYYTHLDFEAFGHSYLESTGAELVSWSPVVDGAGEREGWGTYSSSNDAWVEEGLKWREENLGEEMPEPPFDVPSYIFRRDAIVAPETGDGPFAPIWQMAGAPTDPSLVNFNLLSDEVVGKAWSDLKSTQSRVLSDFLTASDFYGEGATSEEIPDVPQSLLLTPLFNDFESTKMVGAVVAVLSWNLFLQDVLREGDPKIFAVVSSGECGSEYTFEVEGPNVRLIGDGNLHDTTYSEYELISDFATSEEGAATCSFLIKMYPSEELHDALTTNAPVQWTIFVAGIFLVLALGFLIYDLFVQKRQNRVISDAARSNAIVSSLFPAEVRDRLFGKDKKDEDVDYHSHLPENSKFRLKNYLAEEDGINGGEEPTDEAVAQANAKADVYDTKPIADLFPNTTVMFADIAGFTAWSSVREPSQVFTLLETVYRAFDAIAKRRRVFKVETVGDCYVAVTGLPEPRKDHAVVMAKFARECLDRFNELTKRLEITLGPDTAELAMRAGLHSGPVTAGVLRGDKSRFQLFGDTVNTAARVEGTGMRNRVHMSSDTAELLKEAGKESWLRKRPDAVTAKGKLPMNTWWLINPNDKNEEEEEKKESEDDRIAVLGQKMKHLSNEQLFESLPPKIQRLVAWNVEILKKLLQQLIAKRNDLPNGKNYDAVLTKKEDELRRRTNCLDEVTEIIHLPKFNARAHRNRGNLSKIEIPEVVMEQLKRYVAAVAAMHRANPFHNFEHASHVTMSVSKLLSRIVAPDEILNQDDNSNLASNLHDHTYGITSDPLTQFGVVLSALIHDTDHLGVSNFQLIKEDHKLAKYFKDKSIAEQNSIVVAWDRLMSPDFLELRRTIYGDPSELGRFRQIVVNNVLATDIFDKELTAIRRKRWDSAFAKFQTQSPSPEDDVNRKATIVMEHLIQASDVAHTMQHWHIYHKWNERLFQEMITAYQAGRMEKNPAEGWYKGELGFFDNYIIPLAKKLKECGVFGVSSDEYLNYALENRREWASKGKDVLAKYVEKYQVKPKEQEYQVKPKEQEYQVKPKEQEYQVKPKEEETKTADAAPKGKSGADSTDGGVTVTPETSESTEGK
jgi:class 3 adenylate cyclase